MINRRRLVSLAAAALAGVACLPSLPASAQPGYQRFARFLIDLEGWTGNTPDGASMEVPGNSMITAVRQYERGEARLNAQIVIGPAAEGALAAAQPGVKIETPEARMSTSTIDGHQVVRTFTMRDKSGAIIVALGRRALFSLSFNGVDEDEALTLARKFNWAAIKVAIPA